MDPGGGGRTSSFHLWISNACLPLTYPSPDCVHKSLPCANVRLVHVWPRSYARVPKQRPIPRNATSHTLHRVLPHIAHGIFFLLLCQCKAMQTITQPALRSRTPRMWTLGGGGGTGQAASAMQYTVMQSAMSRSEWQSAKRAAGDHSTAALAP